MHLDMSAAFGMIKVNVHAAIADPGNRTLRMEQAAQGSPAQETGKVLDRRFPVMSILAILRVQDLWLLGLNPRTNKP